MDKHLKITRKRSFFRYLKKIEYLAMLQGFDSVLVDSLRWTRLQLCIDSIEAHLLNRFSVYGYVL